MPILDLHSHFSFKPANSRSFAENVLPDVDHWRERFKRKADFSDLITKLDKNVVKSSQLHGNAATEGGFRVIVNALYPLEKGFTSKLMNKPLSTLTGFSPEVLEDIYTGRRSHFQDLEREYRNLMEGQRFRRFSTKGNSYRVVDSAQEIDTLLAGDPDMICIVNSIEGAHAFGDNLYDRMGRAVRIFDEEARFLRRVGRRDGASWFELYIEGMIANIDRIKSTWEHTPFFITLAHHYYNHLCGHSPSLTPEVQLLLPQTGGAPNATGYDTNYFHLGIRPWCMRVVAHLLKRENSLGNPVRRMLIDAKHMSPQARLDYYAIVDQRKQFFNDAIPIVVSHTAVSGRKEIARTIANDLKLFADEEAPSKYFYNGVINLFDDEIVRVVASDGIMGLMIDERRIMGDAIPPEAGITKKDFDVVSKSNRDLMHQWTMTKQLNAWGERNDADRDLELARITGLMAPLLDGLRPAYLSVILRQLFHILDQVGEQGWDHVALGTDFDGVINPIDIYRQSSDMKTLRTDLITFWDASCTHPDPTIAALYTDHRYGKPAAHWIDKLLWENGMAFLRKYYHDGYLKDGVVG
ncbi:MAG: membrane dipeptidase [Flavobacteriales bacterium]|nr:membrane dipeptidase [Flavobacteriales bacterium]